MFRCEATTITGERLTLYGHCPAKGKPVLTWEDSAR
jgi:hypothetical protein